MPATKIHNKNKKKLGKKAPKPALVLAPAAPKSEVRSDAQTDAPDRSGFLWKQRIAPAVLLALVTFTVYVQVLQHPFSNYDDAEYVSQNQSVHSGVTQSMVRWAFTSIDHANWHPITWISHALDWQLFGPSPIGHHFMSLLLHTLSVVLLFLFLAEVTRSTIRSLVVATLFAVHPVSVESVVWIAERKNVLCVLFLFAALLAYASYARRPNVFRYLLVAFLFAVSLASKAMTVTFPFVLLLLDFWPLQRIQKWTQPSEAFPVRQVSLVRIVLEKLPLLALSIADSVVTMIAQRKVGAVRSATAYPFFLRIENAIVSYAAYLWNVIWPVKLSVLYPYPSSGLAAWKVILSASLLVAISVWVWRERSRPYLLTGWCWFLGTLVPVIGLIQVGEQSMADRYAYLPLIGIYMALVWGISDLAQNASPRLRPALPLATSVVLLLLAVQARRQVRVWNSNLDLWAHAVAVTQNNSAAEDVVGSELLMDAMNRGQHYSDEAQVHFQRALAIDPKDSEAIMYIGMDLQARNRVPEAIEEYRQALQYVDDVWLKAKILSGIAGGYELMGDYASAREYFQQALQINAQPDSDAFVGFARTFTDEQIAQVAASFKGHPTAQGLWQLGQLQESAGRPEAARADYQRALDVDPHFTAAAVAISKLAPQPTMAASPALHP
jgi:protein O-mannosyl-transferase